MEIYAAKKVAKAAEDALDAANAKAGWVINKWGEEAYAETRKCVRVKI